MAIQITGTRVANNAAAGTLIGILSCSPPHDGLSTYQLQTNPNGYFVVSGKGELYVAWIGSAVTGNYPIRIHAHGSGWNEFADFSIRVVPVPVGVTFSAPDGSTPQPGGGWRIDVDGRTLEVTRPHTLVEPIIEQHFPLPLPQITVVARNSTARAIQLVWPDELDGLLRPGKDFTFSFPLEEWPISLELLTPISVDGTTLAPGDTGQLYAADGMWTFGDDLGNGIAAVLLNGLRPNSYLWSGSMLRVDHGGALYLQNAEEWWVWTPRRFTRCEAP